MRSRERLRACGWRRVDNSDGETTSRRSRKPIRQPPLGQKLDVGKLVLSAICPYDGALLGVQVEERRLKSAGVPAFVVFNAAPPSATTLIEDAKAIVDAAGLVAAPTVLRERSAYRAAWPLGSAVVENEPNGKAAQEISELQNWVCAQLQVCTSDTLKTEREVAHG